MLRLDLLGGFAARDASGEAIAFPTQKSVALLAYLAINGERAHTREKLAALLWDAHLDGHARANLRQALTRIRRSWPADVPPCICTNGATVSFDCAAIAVDVAEFERLASLGTPEALERAAGLYGGELLEGFSVRSEAFDEWLQAQRRRLSELYAGVLHTLLGHCANVGAVERGSQIAQQLLSLDPLDENIHRMLMRFYLAKERRSAAIAQYRRCRQILQNELGVEPGAETEALYAEILAERGESHRGPAALHIAELAESSTRPPQGASVTSVSPLGLKMFGKPSLAVLPFENQNDDPAEQYLSDGITEDIITEITRFRDLYVIARNSSFVYRGTSAPSRLIASELGVQYLLQGSVRRRHDRVRVTAQLVAADDGHRIWAERYDDSMNELFAVQEDLARRIAVTLAGRIDEDRLDQARRKPSEHWQVYEYCLQGAAYLRNPSMESSRKARAAFEKALEIDSHCARAYAGLAQAQYRAWSCFNWTAWAKLEDEAVNFARKAIALDDGDHHAHCILGTVYLFLREFALARKHLERAVALNPNDANSLANASLGWTLLGNAKRGVEDAETAARLDPYCPDWYSATLGLAHFVARDYPAAIKAMERAPDALCDTRAYLAAACAYAGRPAEAERHAAGFLEFCSDRMGGEPRTDLWRYVEWLLNVNVYRQEEDAAHFVEGLRLAGLMPVEPLRTAVSRRSVHQRVFRFW